MNKDIEESKNAADLYKIADRVDKITGRQSFITIKDHKDDIRTNPRFRLLNPTKNEFAKLSDKILQDINKKLRNSLNLNQWQNSSAVIDWFKNIRNKNKNSFIVFDMEDFCPFISEDLLKKSLSFAKKHIDINNNDISTIFLFSKSFLFHNNEPWVKKTGNSQFNVTTGRVTMGWRYAS